MAGYLSGGEQQMLAIGRALMANPRVLLMDEPSEGLAPQIVAEVMATIRKLKESGLSIVLVEQSPKLVFDIADDIVILNQRPRRRALDRRVAQERRRRPATASRNFLKMLRVRALARQRPPNRNKGAAPCVTPRKRSQKGGTIMVATTTDRRETVSLIGSDKVRELRSMAATTRRSAAFSAS